MEDIDKNKIENIIIYLFIVVVQVVFIVSLVYLGWFKDYFHK
jgi:hypothetical protein